MSQAFNAPGDGSMGHVNRQELLASIHQVNFMHDVLDEEGESAARVRRDVRAPRRSPSTGCPDGNTTAKQSQAKSTPSRKMRHVADNTCLNVRLITHA